jgi:hypothetical protein
MHTITLLVHTKKGWRKAYIRGFSSSASLLADSNDGRTIDRSADIADAYHGDRDGLNTYFREKEASIRRDYREDSNSAAIDGVSARELHSWQENRDDLLEQLNEQREDVFFLASVDGSSDNEGDSVGGNNNLSSSNSNASSPNNGVTGTSDLNAVDSNSNDSSYHPQDTSDVVQTDFSSFDPFED